MHLKNVIAVLAAILETLCVGNIVFGWSAMVYILTRENYFDSGCNLSISIFHNQTSDSVICQSQQYNLELIFTLSVTFGMASGFVG